jgi:hypothetical protein
MLNDLPVEWVYTAHNASYIQAAVDPNPHASIPHFEDCAVGGRVRESFETRSPGCGSSESLEAPQTLHRHAPVRVRARTALQQLSSLALLHVGSLVLHGGKLRA